MGEGPSADGVRRPTMQAVADRVGVSRTLVSLVLRGAPGASVETRTRVLAAAEELGYHPDTAAQVLRANRSRHLGVVFDLGHTFEADLVESLYPAAQEHGYRIVLSAMTPSRDPRHVVDELRGFRAEALVLVGGYLPEVEVARLMADGLPVVSCGRPSRDGAGHVVHSADGRGVARAVDHLAGLGHRAIAHVDGGRRVGATERRRGYRRAMRRHGLARQLSVVPGDYTEEAGARAAADLLGRGELPTAVVAGNDDCALGMLDSFLRAGVRVPEDVSLVGYDDSRAARLPFVNLTTVRQDPRRLAEAALAAVAGHLDSGRTTPTRTTLEPELVVRATTAPPRE